MTYFLAIVLVLAYAIVTAYEVRRAYRLGYEAGLKRARREAAGCVQVAFDRAAENDFRMGVYAGATEVSDRINALKYEDKP